MQTVRPYVGAVKRVSLYIVSQSYQVGCCPLAAVFPQGGVSIEIQVARWSVPPRICHYSSFSVACQVAVQNFRAAHASISARAEGRRFRSEREKFRLFSRGHFSTAGPMAT